VLNFAQVRDGLAGREGRVVDRGTVIDDGSNAQFVQGQESFSVAVLDGMGQNLE